MANSDGLGRMQALLEELGNPEKDFRVIHVAGTNGKGSTSAMIASILEEAGYSVGLYTSPYVVCECERVQIWEGIHRMIESERFDELKSEVRSAGCRLRAAQGADNYGDLTFFEIYTAAAYLYFAEQNPDFIVLETGLGGRLDSTNTIEKPLVSVITQVGLDHTEQLGSTIISIAREKGGIIKAGVPVVSQTGDPAARSVLQTIAAGKGSEFTDVSELYDNKDRRYAELIPELAMQGAHQMRNAATAVEAVRAAGIMVSDDAVRTGLANAYMPGRFEILGKSRDCGPLWIIDGAHNPDAVRELTKTFTAFARANQIKRTLVIFGCMKDKNSARMVQLLTEGLRECSYAATAVAYDRAEDPGHIGGLISECGHGCLVSGNTREAYEYAKTSDFECILVCGSIYLAGEFRAFVKNNA